MNNRVHTASKPFPILIGGPDDPRCPKFIRWEALDDAQAFMNHGQSLERLAERGGLSPSEALAIIEKRRWRKMDWELALAKILPFAYRTDETNHEGADTRKDSVRQARDTPCDALSTKETP